jgi:hypothetical protein
LVSIPLFCSWHKKCHIHMSELLSLLWDGWFWEGLATKINKSRNNKRLSLPTYIVTLNNSIRHPKSGHWLCIKKPESFFVSCSMFFIVSLNTYRQKTDQNDKCPNKRDFSTYNKNKSIAMRPTFEVFFVNCKVIAS